MLDGAAHATLHPALHLALHPAGHLTLRPALRVHSLPIRSPPSRVHAFVEGRLVVEEWG